MKLPATPVVVYLTRILLFSFLFLGIAATFADDDSGAGGSIIFATLGSKSSYSFDIFSLQIPHHIHKHMNNNNNKEEEEDDEEEARLTDGQSLNYNGHWDPLLPNRILFVTERHGSSAIYSTTFDSETRGSRGRRRALLPLLSTESTRRVHLPLLDDDGPGVSMKDRPTLAGEFLLYVSTHEDPGVARTSWAAVYSSHLVTGSTRRLTPYGVADFSPAASPSGAWTAVASLEGKGWGGEVEELGTDIYVFFTRDGSSRVKVVEHGGWPSWADESSLYFHRRGEDGWWSVYKAIFVTKNGRIDVESVVTQRVTPPGLHSFTPSASVANKSLIAVATRRPGSDYRHIELYDVVLNKFVELTRPVTPNAHHFSPFFSPDGFRVGYHKCRGSAANAGKSTTSFFLENMRTPTPEIPLFRVDGSFPSFSPDGSRIAYVNFPGLYIVNADGSGRRKVYDNMVFGTAWDRQRKGVVYTSSGPTFETESTRVDVISVDVDSDEISYKKLTRGGKNNAFPSPSPDGKWVVFRSGRTGHKNLYIMDAVDGETGGLQRLTEGPWSDTMCNWSPDGDWIAFASDRDNPGSGGFALYLIHPNGTGLHKLVQSGSGGRANHPYFSPDGKRIVFTSDYSAVSAEPISNPHQYQPYGEIYTIKTDGSELKRLTHNSFEDGTPAWGPRFMKPVDVEWPIDGPECSFEDLAWLQISSPKATLKDAFVGSSKIQCGG